MAATNNDQLKKKLSAATCALLGTVPMAKAAEDQEKSWNVDVSVLNYQEADDRVKAIEPVLDLRKRFSEGREANLKFTVDVLTGATPNGATPTNVPQTFTTPSGGASYVVAPGEIPLDPTFHDTRFAGNASWKQPLNRLTSLTLVLNGSKEYDFFSTGGSVLLSRDFNEKNTTLMAGLSGEFDQVDPVGGVPVPLATTVGAGQVQPRLGGGDSKNVLDGLLGVTQVINRRTLMQLNYSLSSASGYLNDPYKMLSRIDRNTGSTVDNIYENRPDSRTKHSLYWLTRYNFDRDVISASYRYFFDDWGITSHTLDMNYNWKFAEHHYLEPRLRFYSQSEADFYHLNLISGDPLPREASSDYRLAKFHGFTYGLKWGWDMKNGHAFLLRLEYYNTFGDQSPSSLIGVQRGLDAYPNLKATIAQIQYTF